MTGVQTCALPIFGVAEACALDLDEHLTRPGPRHVDVAELGLALPGRELERSHIGLGPPIYELKSLRLLAAFALVKNLRAGFGSDNLNSV